MIQVTSHFRLVKCKFECFSLLSDSFCCLHFLETCFLNNQLLIEWLLLTLQRCVLTRTFHVLNVSLISYKILISNKPLFLWDNNNDNDNNSRKFLHLVHGKFKWLNDKFHRHMGTFWLGGHDPHAWRKLHKSRKCQCYSDALEMY